MKRAPVLSLGLAFIVLFPGTSQADFLDDNDFERSDLVVLADTNGTASGQPKHKEA